ncbi:hypothetical protein Btru_071590 [Bulinus truncatus]|nr:hypothetical protein Btru_071590 [Bulinus truncatus]
MTFVSDSQEVANGPQKYPCHQVRMAAKTFPRIAYVRAYCLQGSQSNQGADCHDVDDDHWLNCGLAPIATPMSFHEQYSRTRKSWGINALGTLAVEVEAEDGTIGVGVTIGGEPACYIVEKHLSRFVEGQDPRNVELMWDQMFRATLNYGRKGLPIQASDRQAQLMVFYTMWCICSDDHELKSEIAIWCSVVDLI